MTIFSSWPGKGIGCVWLVVMLLGIHSTSAATVQPLGKAAVERGYALLLQAHSSPDESQREQLLQAAAKTFKGAYQGAGREVQLHSLLGAAQSYLAMQQPRRVFPFLWQASPLQRAEKILQQALVLYPDNAAASLLLGIVLWRQAAHLSTGAEQLQQHSDGYLSRARALGIPITRLRDTPPSSPSLEVRDTLVLLRFLDARRAGQGDDLLLVFRTASMPAVCFGIMISEQRAYALSSDETSGALLPAAAPEAVAVLDVPPWRALVARFRQPQGSGEVRFTWDGSRFVTLPAAP